MSRFSEETLKKVIALMDQGVTQTAELAEQLKVSKTTIKTIKRHLREPSEGEPSELKDDPQPEGAKAEERASQGDEEEEPESSIDDLMNPDRTDRRDDERGSQEEPSSDQKDQLIEQLQARIAVLIQSNEMSMRAAAKGTVAGESVAGRPSLAAFREDTWRKMAGTVISLPAKTIKYGRDRTIELVAGTLQADLAVLALGAPPNPTVAKMRVATEHLISDRAKLAVMLGNDAAGRALRTIFLRAAIKYYFSPSVQKLFEKGVEQLTADQLGFGQQ